MPRSAESITNPVASPQAAPATATPSHEIAFPVTRPTLSQHHLSVGWAGPIQIDRPRCVR